MYEKALRTIWAIVILLFIGLQAYHLIVAGYTDIVISLLTVIIILALVVSYWLIAQVIKGRNKKVGYESKTPKNLE